MKTIGVGILALAIGMSVCSAQAHTSGWLEVNSKARILLDNLDLQSLPGPLSDTSTEAVCEPSPDAASVILFIDFNQNEREVKAAQRAACTRGEGFVHIPGLEHSKVLGPLRTREFLDREEFDRLRNINNRTPEQEARKKLLEDRVDSIEQKIMDYVAQHSLDIVSNIEPTMQKLSDRGQKISAIVVSGHHSGGHFYGEWRLGEINDSELWAILKKFPSVVENTSLLALWGCDTVTPFDSKLIKVEMPQLKVIAGFYDTAPSGLRQGSYEYLQSVLENEKYLQSAEDLPQVKSALSSISRLYEVFSGLYLQARNGLEWFFDVNETSRDSERRPIVRAQLQNFEAALGCEYFEKVSRDKFSVVPDYISGAKDTPSDKRASDLRDVYDFAHQNSDCLAKSNYPYTPSYLGLLLWFDGVKQNFAKTFSTLTASATQEAALINEAALRVYINPIESKLDQELVKANRLYDIVKMASDQKRKELEEKLQKSHAAFRMRFDKLRKKFQNANGAWVSSSECEIATRNAIDSGDRRYTESVRGCLSYAESARSELNKRQKRKQADFYQMLKDLVAEAADARKVNIENEQKVAEAGKKFETARSLKIQTTSQFMSLIRFMQSRPELKSMSVDASANVTRAEWLANARSLEMTTSVVEKVIQFIPEAEPLRAQIKNVSVLRQKMKRYIEDLDTTCMQFSEWHEFDATHTARALCE